MWVESTYKRQTNVSYVIANTMTSSKVSKAINLLVEESCLSVVDKLVCYLDAKIEIDDDMKQYFESFKQILRDELKEDMKSYHGSKSARSFPKKKRAPSAYNLFIKEKMALIKVDQPELKSKDLMKEAIALWNAKKSAVEVAS